MNQNTWSAYGAMPDLNRLTVQDLASMWHQLTVRPNVLQRPTHLPSTLNRAPTTPASPHMGQSLTRHWGAMSSLVTPYNSPVEPKDSPLCEEPSCKNKPKRFTVTPAYVDNDVF
ncbi:uncharacterized protein LOC128997730 [Macrosteles quadrilineatus]|uniref:uncharacterized protein LOC128997730 n=1 Tax=Macrosteles quadrilineatus TaxID=74068 RepID=UPI0023E21D29|nr:uncharacterized protein LOC128997730 [Macrosteles quadrilineatus]